MKKLAVLIIISIASGALKAQIPDSVIMDQGYQKQVYYQLTDGSQTPVAFSSWDIGLQTSLMTASIIINEQTCKLYYADGADTSQYATLDVSNYTSWPRYYNSEQSWNIGALNQLANPGNQFDFGWGIYDFTKHTVFGTRLFVLEVSGQAYKLWIRKKTASGNYEVRFTPITAGAADVDVTVNAGMYTTKNFVYLKLATASVIDAEPANCCWQLLFTRYAANIPMMGYYMVTGVYIAPGVKAVKAYPVDVETDSFPLHQSGLSTQITTIGYDWKYYDPVTMLYVMEDSLLYYVQDASGKKVWRLQFTGFDYMKGITHFTRELVYDATVSDEQISPNILDCRVFPNPARDVVRVMFLAPASWITLQLTDATGRSVFSQQYASVSGINTLQLEVPNVHSGVYFLQLRTNDHSVTYPVVIAH